MNACDICAGITIPLRGMHGDIAMLNGAGDTDELTQFLSQTPSIVGQLYLIGNHFHDFILKQTLTTTQPVFSYKT